MEMEGEEENMERGEICASGVGQVVFKFSNFNAQLAGRRSDLRQLSSRSLGKSHANSTRCPSLRATG